MTPVTQESEAFNVQDKLILSDPCYIDSDDFKRKPTPKQIENRLGSHGLVIDNCEGIWVATIEPDHGPIGRLNCARLVLDRRGVLARGSGTYLGSNSVDSGQMMAICRSNLPFEYDDLLDVYKDDDGQWVNLDLFGFKGGVVSSTGHGDGAYPVTMTTDQSGLPAQIIVDFLPEDETCEECLNDIDYCSCDDEERCEDCDEEVDYCVCDDEEERI